MSNKHLANKINKYIFFVQFLAYVKFLLYLCTGFEKIPDPPILADAASPFSSVFVPVMYRKYPPNHPLITP